MALGAVRNPRSSRPSTVCQLRTFLTTLPRSPDFPTKTVCQLLSEVDAKFWKEAASQMAETHGHFWLLPLCPRRQRIHQPSKTFFGKETAECHAMLVSALNGRLRRESFPVGPPRNTPSQLLSSEPPNCVDTVSSSLFMGTATKGLIE
ncbi:unnamed protein product [Caenorhabditis auriculariae]|uniref:Uncharacterized protein n=1 Tax=Caenorhabditis auriculariae TaxID=2777116 RepID=A0A8S1GZU1_9PELO|nr:unnamed protein product [Caenorhabditis auriculariae]